MSEEVALVGEIVWEGQKPLPSGGWVELRDPKTLRARDKKAALKAVKDHNQLMAAGLDIVDGIIVMLVVAWKLPYYDDAPLPSQTWGVIDELTIPDYDELTELIAPAQRILFPGATTPDDAGRPGSPTVPAAG